MSRPEEAAGTPVASETIEEAVAHMGERIARLRADSGLSIQRLADLSGVSTAAVYKIEKNEMVPSIAILMKLAAALGVTVGYLVGEEEAAPRVLLIKQKTRRKRRYVEAGLEIELITGPIRGSALEAGITTIEPGSASGPAEIHNRGERVVLCLDGAVEYSVDGTSYNLRRGDTLHFDAELPHAWRNTAEKPAKVLYILRPPPVIS